MSCIFYKSVVVAVELFLKLLKNVLYCMFVSLLTDTLLDDFLLTYPVFMSTSDLCQALLGQYP